MLLRSMGLRKAIFIFLLLGQTPLVVQFYNKECELLAQYDVRYVVVSQEKKQIIIDEENGRIFRVPFNGGFYEFVITTHRGFERIYHYKNRELIQNNKRECMEAI